MQLRKGSRGRRKGRTKRRDPPLAVSRVNSIFDCSASRHSRLRQGSKIDYSSITLRLVSSSAPSPGAPTCLSPLSSTLPVCVCVCVSYSSLRFPHPTLFQRLSSPTVCSVHPDPSDPSGSTVPTPGPSRGSSSPSPPFAPPLSRPDLGASRLHVACPNDVSERTGTTAI